MHVKKTMPTVDFHTALMRAEKQIYQPLGLDVKDVQKESQNAKYGAGIFTLSSRTIRFRVAKTTPTKTGQFVAV